MKADLLRLQALKQKFAGDDVMALQVEGAIPDEILSLAREHEASLIVMGSHGHGALYRLLVGSVTNAVLKAGVCPVVVVPSKRGAVEIK